MHILFHLMYENDLYEVSLKEYTITRITRYHDGCHRQDVEYDSLPMELRERILKKTIEVLSRNS